MLKYNEYVTVHFCHALYYRTAHIPFIFPETMLNLMGKQHNVLFYLIHTFIHTMSGL